MTDLTNLFHNTLTLAQAPGGQAPSPFPMFIAFGFMIAAMWFLVIAPQRKKQKEAQKMITELKSGDDVLTIGGIFGTITNVKNDRFVLRIADNTKIEVLKSAVQSRASDAPVEEKKK